MASDSAFSPLSFACATILDRTRALSLLNAYSGSIRSLYTGYIFPLALFPTLCFSTAFLLQGSNGAVPPSVAAMSAFFTFAISVVVFHFWSLIIEGLLNAQGYTASRIDALKITILAGSPWFIIFSLFPVIHGFVLLGALWVITLVPFALKHLGHVAPEKLFRLSIATLLLWMASLLFANQFFVGILSIAVVG